MILLFRSVFVNDRVVDLKVPSVMVKTQDYRGSEEEGLSLSTGKCIVQFCSLFP